jgi:pimeloyl-ACP methyl ester carboxylesterase
MKSALVLAHPSLPGARLERVEGAGHFVSLEQPDKYNAIAEQWLARVEK